MNIDDTKPSDEDLSMLTDEERAGLAEDDGDDGDDGENGEGDAGGGDEAGGTEQGGEAAAGAGTPAGEAAAGKTPEAPAPDEPPAPAADDDEGDSGPRPAPLDGRVDEQVVKGQIEDIQAKKETLAQRLDDGEITTKEYTEAVDKLNDDRNALTNQLQRQQDHDKAITDAWYKDVGKFLDRNPELKSNDTRLQSFDAVVRRVTGDAANASLSNRKQLEKAHQIWREELGIPAPAPKDPPAKAPAAQTPPKPAPAQKAPRPELPPTLHNLPAAEGADAGEGKFGYLDALLNAGRSIEYEAALSKLSEADQMDYLSQA